LDADSNAFSVTTGHSGENWFAVQVRTRWERSTATLLAGKGYDIILPTYKAKRRWSGRLKHVVAPLFPGYVFCRFDALKRLPILVTPGVIAVVGTGRNPVPVEDGEISAIQAVVSSGLSAEPWPYLEMGQRVRIEDDALRGLEGILIGFKGSHRIVVSVSLLRRSVALEIERSRVSLLHPTRDTVTDSLSLQPLLDGVIA
jgi:transcription termination/antitermination protein NusG